MVLGGALPPLLVLPLLPCVRCPSVCAQACSGVSNGWVLVFLFVSTAAGDSRVIRLCALSRLCVCCIKCQTLIASFSSSMILVLLSVHIGVAPNESLGSNQSLTGDGGVRRPGPASAAKLISVRGLNERSARAGSRWPRSRCAAASGTNRVALWRRSATASVPRWRCSTPQSWGHLATRELRGRGDVLR